MLRCLASVALLALSACGASRAELAVRECTAAAKEMNATLEGIIDLESAREAKDDVARHQARINALDTDALKMADVATARHILTDPELAPSMVREALSYLAHMKRLAAKDDIYEELKDVFNDLEELKNQEASPR